MTATRYKIMAKHYMDCIYEDYEEWDGELYDSCNEAYAELLKCRSVSWVKDAYIKEV